MDGFLKTGIGRRRGRWDRGGVERPAGGAVAEDGSQVEQLADLSKGDTTRMLFDFSDGGVGDGQHRLVERPFLEAKGTGPLVPVLGFLLEECLQGAVGGGGPVVIEGGGAGFPTVAVEELAEAVHRATESSGGRLPGRAGNGELQPGGEEVIRNRVFAGLGGPEGLRVDRC